MQIGSIAIGLTILTHLLLVVSPAGAECIAFSGRVGALVKSDYSGVIVFSGTVTLIERTSDITHRATITVDRVWTGRLRQRVTVDVSDLSPETPDLQINRQYLLAALERDSADPALHLGASRLWLPPCSDMPYDQAVKEGVIRALGDGRPPND